MIKKLVSHGNSAALIIDKPILELLNVDLDTPLEITTDGKNLIISPVKASKREKSFRSAVEKVNRLHGRTLNKLAG
jgi:antitoxin MazE